jgi:3-oxoacyl-[acyl-carrier protein] reductase
MAKIALVTGGSGAIGREISARLAKDGYALAVHYSANAEEADEADEVVQAVKHSGGRAISVGGDISNEDEFD